MLANVLVNGLMHESIQQATNSAFSTCNQLAYAGKSDILAVAVIGVIVVAGVVFMLMCRYE